MGIVNLIARPVNCWIDGAVDAGADRAIDSRVDDPIDFGIQRSVYCGIALTGDHKVCGGKSLTMNGQNVSA